jgi:hypothetical protein
MAKTPDEMMFDVAMQWNELLNDVADEEGATIFASHDNFTMEVKQLTYLVEAFQAEKPIDLAKLSWNEDIDGAGDYIEWSDRVIAAMNYAVAWLREHIETTDE